MGLYEALNRLSFFFPSYFYQLTRRRPTPSVSQKARARARGSPSDGFLDERSLCASKKRAIMKQTRSARAVCHIHFCTVAPTPKDDVAFRETDHVQNFCLAFCHQPTNLFPCKSPDGKLNPMPLPTPYSRVVSISFFLSPSPSSSSSSLYEWCLLFVNTRTRTTNREEGAEGGEKKIQYFCNAIKSSI